MSRLADQEIMREQAFEIEELKNQITLLEIEIESLKDVIRELSQYE